MGNGYLFKTARACALVSLLWPTLVPLVQAESDELPPQNNSQTPRGEAIEFLTMFWSLAWELEFIPGRSGMVLSEQLGDDMRLVVVGDSGAEDPFVAEGIFVEAHREFLDYRAWSDDRLEEAGALNVDHFFSAGMLYGSGGFEGAVVAMVQEILVPGPEPDEPVLLEIISPFELAPDLDSAITEVMILGNLYHVYGDIDEGNPAGQTADPQEPTVAKLFRKHIDPTDDGSQPAPKNCGTKHTGCKIKCWYLYDGDKRYCWVPDIACVIACGLGCLAFGFGTPLYFGCIAVCWAGCLKVDNACKGSAHARWRACLWGCETDHMDCDPNYVPPDLWIR